MRTEREENARKDLRDSGIRDIQSAGIVGLNIPILDEKLAKELKGSGVDISSLLAGVFPRIKDIYRQVMAEAGADVQNVDDVTFGVKILTGREGAEEMLSSRGYVKTEGNSFSVKEQEVLNSILFFSDGSYVSTLTPNEKDGGNIAYRALPFLDEIKRRGILPTTLIKGSYNRIEECGEEKEKWGELTVCFVGESAAREFVKALEEVRNISLKDIVENPDLLEKHSYAKDFLAGKVGMELGFDYGIPPITRFFVQRVEREEELDRVLSRKSTVYERTEKGRELFEEQTVGALLDAGKVEGRKEEPLIDALAKVGEIKPEQVKCLYRVEYYNDREEDIERLELVLYKLSDEMKELLAEKVKERRKELAQKKEQEIERSGDRGISLGG